MTGQDGTSNGAEQEGTSLQVQKEAKQIVTWNRGLPVVRVLRQFLSLRSLKILRIPQLM